MIPLRVIFLAVTAAVSIAQSCNPGPADVMFVLSSDSRMDKNSFDNMIRIVEKFTQSVKIGPNDVRVGLITEYNYADLEFHMNDHLAKPELSLAILFTYFVDGDVTPAFGSGLQYIKDYGMDAALGGRPGVPNIVIFLTDGVPADSRFAQTQVQLLTDSGVTVMAVGGGDSHKLDLIYLASGCHYVVPAPNLFSAEDIALPAINLTCDAIKGVPVDECECELTADVVFLLDASSAQGKANYTVQKNFANALASELNIAPNQTRIAAVTYADFSHPQFGLTAHLDRTEAALALSFLPFQGDSGRHVEMGLDFINANLTGSAVRASAEKIVVIVATGSLSSPSKAQAAALQLKNQGYSILSVGVGTAKENELESLATNSDYAKLYPNFSSLLAGAPSLGKLLCQGRSLRTTMNPLVTAQSLSNSCTGSTYCQNGGTCVQGLGVKVCQCPQGYSGNVCQNTVTSAPIIKVCQFNPCYNGGTCVVMGDQFSCQCAYGFGGLTCNDKISTTPRTTVATTTPTTPNPNGCPNPPVDSTYYACGPSEIIFLIEYGRYDDGEDIDHEGDFFKYLLDEYKYDSQHVRVGVVVYHDTVREVVHLKDYENNRDGLKRRIEQLNNQLKPSGTPDLAGAMDYVRQNSFTDARPGVLKYLVSVVHQMPRSGQSRIIQAGQRLKDDCIVHSVQAVRGSTVNENTLREIASDPSSRFYHSYSSFSSLERGGYYYNVRCPSS